MEKKLCRECEWCIIDKKNNIRDCCNKEIYSLLIAAKLGWKFSYPFIFGCKYFKEKKN
jgi:hypothetical protein